MKSISESIILWLTGYSGITSAEKVDTDQVGEEAVSLGLLKAPGRNETIFVDGSKEVTAYYLFRARRAAQQDNMRIDNQEWLEALESWVWGCNFTRTFPQLSGGRQCQSVRVSQSSYVLEAGETEITYQIGLEINYSEPKTLSE